MMAAKQGGKTPPAGDEALDDAGQDASGDSADDSGWDAEGEHTLAVDRIEAMAADVELSTEEMVFDIRDFLLDIIKTRPKPWSGTSQAEQRDIAAACEHAAKDLVRKVVEGVASNGVSSIRVLLTKVNMGTDIVISGKVKTFGEEDEDAAVLALHRAINKHVMLTRATAEDYSGGERDADTDPDEPGFGFEGDDDDE